MEESLLLESLRGLLPNGKVITNSELLRLSAEYGLEQNIKQPICILEPANEDELDTIIHFANEHNVNITVTSSTGTHRKGGITNQSDHILINLAHWKIIDLIDRRNRVCRIQPGVTYQELTQELQKYGMTIPMPLAPRNSKSVLSAVMDREPTTWTNKQWDSVDPVGSTDFYFGSGDHFRTGSAGGPGSLEKQKLAGGAQKFPDGPSQIGFHRVLSGSQGTMGIINWITVRTELLPSINESFIIGSNTLDILIDYMYAVQRELLGEQTFIINSVASKLLLKTAPNKNSSLHDVSVPEFICFQSISGFERLPKERLSYQKKELTKIANQCDLQLEKHIGELSADKLYEIATNTNGDSDWRNNSHEKSLSIFFQTTLNKTPAFIKLFKDIFKNYDITSDIGIYIQPIVQNHACHIEFILPISPDQSVKSVLEFEKEVTKKLIESGAFFNRPYGAASDAVWLQNPENTNLVKTIKHIFDPRTILQKGKWFNAINKKEYSTKDADLSELEKIVGKEWVTTSPCILDTYAYYMNPEIINDDGSQWLPRPAAVVLPKSTEEIQEIMRFCSTSKYMAKPISTGFHAAAAASNQDVIIIDLKRMNHIVEIDYKNQIAVVEPYVRAIDLQTEIVKQGLNCHIVSSGANHSLLASHTAAWGYGTTGAATSFSGRNLLGLEWILPTGEIVTLGSAGSGSGWFSPDGPGPSMRGVVRGFQGTFGGLGVFTKCAIKLYKWDGPREWDFEGESPKYILTKIPPRCFLNAVAFPSYQAERDAGYKMGEAELNHGEFRTPMFFTALGLTETNEELKTALESGLFHKIAKNVLSIAMFSASDEEFKWKIKALKQILHETGGVIIPINLPMNPRILKIGGKLAKPIPDPFYLFRKLPFLQGWIQHMPFTQGIKRRKQSILFWLLFRNANNTQAAFRPSQGMATMLGAFDTWDLAHTQAEYVAKLKMPYIKRGVILDDGGDLGSGGTFEHGHLGYLEGIILYDPGNVQSAMAARELVEAGIKDTINNAMGVPIAAFGFEANKKFGPACNNYDIWLRKIKTALDPNTASDPFFYATTESSD